MKEKLALSYHNQLNIQLYIICSLKFSGVRTFNDKPLPTGTQVEEALAPREGRTVFTAEAGSCSTKQSRGPRCCTNLSSNSAVMHIKLGTSVSLET